MLPTEIAAKIDHTQLKAEATPAQIAVLCDEAKAHGFASVCVNGAHVPQAAEALRGSGVKVCAVAGFPLGAMKPTVKAIEATTLVKDGASEVDFVAHLPSLLAQDGAAARAEYTELVKAARAVLSSVVVKAILETGALMDGVGDDEAEARIALACRAAQESGVDFVKTSTGFHPTGGATVQAVRLLRKHAGPMSVKASGGIRSADDAKAMMEAGADRLGCSAGVKIVQGLTGDAAY